MVMRWDPWRELNEMRRQFSRGNRLFDATGLARAGDGDDYGDEMGSYTLGVDVSETPDRFLVNAAVPGMRPEDVEINVENDVLTIRGRHREEQTHEEGNYL